MEDQTNNKIREEKLNTLKSMLWELGHTDKDAHHVIEYVDELLKSQEQKLREELVGKIEKYGTDMQGGNPLPTVQQAVIQSVIQEVLSLIKNN